MTKYRFAPLVVIVLLISGCGGVQDEPSTVPTENQDGNRTTGVTERTTRNSTVTSPDGISVRGGALSVNATTVFSNVLALIVVDAHRPVIVIENRTTADGNEASSLLVDDFGNALGLTPSENVPMSDRPGGFTAKNTVYLLPGNGSDSELRRVLAHEFVHVLQYQQEWQPYRHGPNANVDANSGLLAGCLSEGSATYVTDEYVRRYSVDAEPNTAIVREGYLKSNGTRKYLYAQYYFCSRYLHSRLDSPANITHVYRDPPLTTEQVIHNYTPQEELPRNLDVTVDETNASWDRRTDSTKGELFTRVVLANALPKENASRAAEGWGNDRLIEFRNDERRGYVWILRWDSTDDAEQFVKTFGRYLDARGAGLDGCLDLTCFEQRRVGPRTSAVLVGPSSFVSNATVEAENQSVRVGTN